MKKLPGRSGHRWEDDINMNPKKMGFEYVD
jgi:hypothetical protein